LTTKKQDLTVKIALKLLKYISYRYFENKVALQFFSGSNNILDVGCGQGGFIENDPSRIQGIDINPNNINKCIEKGFTATESDALNIKFEDNTFDGAYCSHVIQLFDYNDALLLLRELRRIVKPNGLVVIASFPDHKRLFTTPETFRAYPPIAIRRLIAQASDYKDSISSPTYADAPLLIQEGIWLRRPALIEFEGPKSETATNVSMMLNLLQHKLFLRKYWTYNGYVIKLRNGPK
tara:strand:- start:119 stop:826 length:708 start_codon:yes stop_codon:yes gene_type:complete